ncbi:MAG: citrate synthase [Chloroflexi bacterium]|nr:citrate synthase [Chloroflexota bacterium]
MTQAGEQFSKGLEGVIAAESSICFIDGQAGVLIYRGYNIHDLAKNSSFEETAFLLWNDRLPTKKELEVFSADLAANRAVPEAVVDLLRKAPPTAMPMDVLRTAVSAAAFFDPDVGDNSPEATRRKATRLTAQMSTYMAYYHRMRNKQPSVPPRRDLSHAANFVSMLTGAAPDPVTARAVDVALVLHAEHGFNASTFTARVIAATESDLHAAIAGAIGALKGPLHGGANERVLEMLAEIGDKSKVDSYLSTRLARKEKISGFGHRVYKTLDPRAVHLKQISEELGKRRGDDKLYQISLKVQEAMKRLKNLDANVDFFSASVYSYLGIPEDLFTPIFAISRIAGWSAHVMEQHASNRLIRPRALYTGKKDLSYVPMQQRS